MLLVVPGKSRMTDNIDTSLKTNNQILKRIIPGLIFGLVVFIVLGLFGDLREVSRTLEVFEWQYYPFVILFTLLNYLLRFFKWHYYLKQVGVKGITWFQSMRLFLAGFPLAVTPGKVGEALKGVWLKQAGGIPVGRGISVVLAERISDGLAVLALSTMGVIAYPRYWPAFAAVLGILLAVIVFTQIRPRAMWVLDLGEKIPLFNRFANGIRDLYEGSFALFRPRAVLIAVSLGTVSWFGEGLGMYFVLLSVNRV